MRRLINHVIFCSSMLHDCWYWQRCIHTDNMISLCFRILLNLLRGGCCRLDNKVNGRFRDYRDITSLFLARYQPRGRIVNRKPKCRNEYHQDKICATYDKGSLGWTHGRLTFPSNNERIVFLPQPKLLFLRKWIKVNVRKNIIILRHLNNKRQFSSKTLANANTRNV